MATAVCATEWCARTPCRTHIFLTHVPCVAYRHRVWLKVFAVRMSRLPISPSPFPCFIHRLCCSRTVTSTLRSCLHLPCRTVPDPKARVKRTSARAPRSLATWPIPRTPHSKWDDNQAWSSQEWKTDTSMSDRSGQPVVTSWGKTRESQTSFFHEKTQHDGTAQSVVNEVIPRERSRIRHWKR